MIIKEILEQLKTSKNPVAKAIHKGEHFKVLALALNKGMILKEHKAHITSKLTVLEGAVIYKEENRTITLNKYDEVEIPIEITHSVEATQDSLCILTQGNNK